MKEIRLHNVDKVALVNAEDYEYLNQYTWHLGMNGDNRNLCFLMKNDDK